MKHKVLYTGLVALAFLLATVGVLAVASMGMVFAILTVGTPVP